MDIYWYGQSMFKIKGKSATVIFDPYDPEYTGLKLPKDTTADLCLSSHNHNDHSNFKAVEGKPLVISGPGEYEKSGITIEGVATYHDASNGSERGRNTVYHLLMDGVNIVHLGDLGHLLTDDQVNEIGDTDILMIPAGSVFTIDGETAAKVVAQLEPRIVIPMHYKISGLKFELEEAGSFLKEMGAENLEPVAKLSITKDKLPEETTVVVLNKS